MRTRHTVLGLLLAGTSPLALPDQAALAQAPVVLEDIIIIADRGPAAADRTGSAVSVVTEAEIEARSRPFALDLLRQLPGVSVSQEYVRVLVDGIEISDPTGPQVAPSLSGLLAGGLSRIEVLRGSQSALYGGRAVAGVIDISTARPERDGIEHRFEAEAGRYDTQRGAYTLAARTENVDAAFTLQGLTTDGFSAAERRVGNTERDGYETVRGSFAATIYASDTLRFVASGFVQDEDGDFDSGFPIEDAPNTFATDSWGLRAGVEADIGPVEHRLAYSRFDIDRTTREVSAFGASRFDADGQRDRVEYLGRWGVDPALAVQFGADYARERAETRFDSGGFVSESGRLRDWIAGGFVQAIWIPIDPLTLNATLRYDHHSEFDGYVTGRASAAYVLPGETILRASAGRGFRPPSLNELFGPFGANPDLDPETSRSFDAGLEQPFAEGRARLAATLFWIEVEDRIEFLPDGYAQADGRDRSRGVELAGTWAVTERIALTGAYTYTEAERADGTRRNRVPRHDLVLGAEAVPVERLTIGASMQRVADVVDRTGTLPPGTPDFIGAYTLVNAKAAYAVTDRAELYIRAENLLDEQYQTARGFGTSDRAFYVGLQARF
jgi:vitamin B12 transporter